VPAGIWWGDLRKRDHLEDVGIEGEDNIEMDLLAVGCGGMDSIYLAQEKDRWWAFVMQ
jgi:hypothetical protein